MRIGVCGIACEICPKRLNGSCPDGPDGCTPKRNPFCAISTCAFERGVRHCFECPAFPCELTKTGPLHDDYCEYLSGKAD